MNTSKRSFLAASVLAFTAFASTAHAIDRDFTVHNNINATVRELYVSPTSQRTWGPDILGADVLEHGQATTIHFTPSNYRGQCIFDIKLVGTDGGQWVVSGINLCTITDVTFNRTGDRVTFEAH